ncbi:MAG: hypothetical protein VKL59_24140 [Nostocaceae cyanobacterium]|nr:hypothetical protein [Nostocaceae cyanobacterium]
MISERPGFCFCTLAFGKKYRALALLLAKDIEKYAPYTSFLVLSDEPQEFSEQSNVISFKHRQQSVKGYHDKRFAFAKALELFNACIFLDADMRILGSVPQDMQWIQQPGISARGCEVMSKKYAKVLEGSASARVCREFQVSQKAAQMLGLAVEHESIPFVYEYLFSVTKDGGKELEFLKQWDMIAPYFELNGVYDAEGNAIALAAVKVGLSVRWCEMKGIDFFKDKTELIRIKNGQSKMEDMAIYFQQQGMLEYPQLSFWEKVVGKLGKEVRFFYYLLRLRVVAVFRR